MIEVEVLINNFKDKKNYSKKITIVRDGKETELQYDLLQKGDKYKVSKDRYEELSKLEIVAKVKKEPKGE